jgi:MFS transporter, MHS family, citrate/tricarballylate:H+ symporter
MSAAGSTEGTTRREKIRAVFRVASGNFLEMYDFMIFGYFSAAIGRAYFPPASEFASLMFSMTTFAVGFMVRPLGAIFLGAYIDHLGRRKGLLLTLGLMSVGTLTIALVPGYESIGLLAPIVVVLGRLCQGFSAGVELGGVSVYLSEIATPGHKGFYVSWQSSSQQVAVVFAGVLGYLLSKRLPPEALDAWGWRIPLIIGCLIVPFIYLIRRSLKETEEFAARKERPTPSQIYWSLLKYWRILLPGMLMVLMTTVSFYTITAYTPTFGKTVLKLSSQDALLVTLMVAVTNFFWNPVGGAVSDRIGHKPVLLTIAALSFLTAYPALHWLVAAPTFGKMLAVEMMFSFYFGVYSGTMLGCLVEIVPAHVRTTCFSLAFALAAALFGTFTPFAATWLIDHTGDKASPGFWLMCAATLGIIATLTVYRGGRTIETREAVAA